MARSKSAHATRRRHQGVSRRRSRASKAAPRPHLPGSRMLQRPAHDRPLLLMLTLCPCVGVGPGGDRLRCKSDHPEGRPTARPGGVDAALAGTANRRRATSPGMTTSAPEDSNRTSACLLSKPLKPAGSILETSARPRPLGARRRAGAARPAAHPGLTADPPGRRRVGLPAVAPGAHKPSTPPVVRHPVERPLPETGRSRQLSGRPAPATIDVSGGAAPGHWPGVAARASRRSREADAGRAPGRPGRPDWRSQRAGVGDRSGTQRAGTTAAALLEDAAASRPIASTSVAAEHGLHAALVHAAQRPATDAGARLAWTPPWPGWRHRRTRDLDLAARRRTRLDVSAGPATERRSAGPRYCPAQMS